MVMGSVDILLSLDLGPVVIGFFCLPLKVKTPFHSDVNRHT